MASHSHNDSISLPKHKAKHVPKLSLLPFEIYAPGSQLSPPMGSQQNIYDEYFSPSMDTLASSVRPEMRDGYFGQERSQESRPEDRQKKPSSSKKPMPTNQRFPEFVPHHTRSNSSNSSNWAKSSTSSATLAIAETRTILAHPPRKGSEITIDYSARKGSEAMGKYTGDNRGRKNYSMPMGAYQEGRSSTFTTSDYLDNRTSQVDRERKDSTARLIPSPLEIFRRPSYGSLRTPLTVPNEELAALKPPSPAQISRDVSPMQVSPDVPRKDSSTLPWGSEDSTPAMVETLPKPWEKYRSQIMGNPFDGKSHPMPSPIYEEDKFDFDSWPLPLPAGRKSKIERQSILKLELGALDMTDAASIYTARKTIKPYSYFIDEPESRYTKVKRVSESCWGRWSTRQLILASTAVILLILLAVGLSTGLVFSPRKSAASSGLTPTWRPAIGNTWQILSGEAIAGPTLRAQVYNIDLFANNASIINVFHKKGRRVICYFSAGTYESWRPDASKFTNTTIGNPVANSTGENWLDTTSQSVRDIMEARIKLAKSKGCDGVNPDNMDGYLFTGDNGTGFGLSATTGVEYMRWLSNTAHHLDVAIGLRNSAELINQTMDVIDWQLNEGCAQLGNCDAYQPFIEAGKPVFHIEYATNASASVLNMACNADGSQHFSTLIKKSSLDSWAAECPYGDPAYEAD